MTYCRRYKLPSYPSDRPCECNNHACARGYDFPTISDTKLDETALDWNLMRIEGEPDEKLRQRISDEMTRLVTKTFMIPEERLKPQTRRYNFGGGYTVIEYIGGGGGSGGNGGSVGTIIAGSGGGGSGGSATTDQPQEEPNDDPPSDDPQGDPNPLPQEAPAQKAKSKYKADFSDWLDYTPFFKPER